MGKGIAVEFKKRYAGIDLLKKQVAAGKKSGSCATLTVDNRLICYLITKPKFFNKPTYESLEESLKDMAKEMNSHGVSGCVVPRIGCGLDRLEWNKVQEIIERVFSEANVSALICSL